MLQSKHCDRSKKTHNWDNVDQALVRAVRKLLKKEAPKKAAWRWVKMHQTVQRGIKPVYGASNSHKVLNNLSDSDVVTILNECRRNPLLLNICNISGWLARFAFVAESW
eukprot:Blabericola_migrator_1__5061@NODE_2620_length_2528_cov_21_982527_g1642_i0_p3_GENE_NODE_2620_length_2528_cov_21_982527_g1642_i0NODE_2620_length_2528_cov_21_982527_g1642_i0_p3_ORF_typecomplete_len109_score21_12Penicil_amidase/PF01804_18/0_034Gemini_V2/PF01524_17/0_11DUF1296/PF06972_11/1_6e03DUF1296/PF06972_11/0_68RNase_J_C/PF17770_1/0_91RNase_J_C/PF17770_1/64_NODE_2620_length_2528_cov_21_982527_g1642_i021782504